MFFSGAKVVGSLPYDKTDAMAVDITPIDQASRAVADIIVSGRPGVYHIAAERPLYYNRLCTLMKEEGFGLAGRHYDCGAMLYDREKQDVHAGGSGAGCSAAVAAAYFLPLLARGKLKRVVFAATGALMSPLRVNQGETIPAIAHLVCFES